MRKFPVLLAGMAVLASMVFAQNKPATISGRVSDPEGAPVPKAPVQAKNAATGAVYRGLSSASGDYTLTQVPAGKYELSVNVPCCAYQPFTLPDVTVEPDKKLSFDIRLAEGGSYRTLGDDPNTLAEMIRVRAGVETAPAPRMSDGKPDLSGVWQGNDDLYPEQPDLLPWADALVKQRIANNLRDAPPGRRLPGGPVVTGPFLVKLVQTPNLLVMILEDFVAVRQVFMDGRGHPKEMNPSWYGHAIAKWEGDTLVIDTVGFNDKGWINIYPITEQLHLTERYHRRDLAHLDIEVTIDGPGTFKHPWKLTMVWDLAPKEEVGEFVCEDSNKDAAHFMEK
jgi:Carboxypeptidase regulatory-like domain